MKRLLAICLAVFLVMPLAFAQGSENMQNNVPERAQAVTTSITEQNLTVAPIQAQEKVKTLASVAEAVQTRQQVMAQELQSVEPKERQVLQNQNQVRLAVHALLESEELIGGIGPQVSAIAKEFNNSVQATIRTEEKIQTRNALVRFFAGGNSEAARELKNETAQNHERIQEMKQLMDECDCEEPVKEMLQEQLQSMEHEQTRLQKLADKELQSKGLFGWLWK